MDWPKNILQWVIGNTHYMSIPFTWNLPEAQAIINRTNLFWDKNIVGGPAVKLMPNYLSGCEIQNSYPRILQMINPLATRTTLGCPRRCGFCGVIRFEGKFKELDDWQDGPVICDNNLLASSDEHFNKVMDKLVKWDGVDFNQGLDCRLLGWRHAIRLRELKKPKIRLALDASKNIHDFECAYECLREQKIAKNSISVYLLCGYKSDPADALKRVKLIERLNITALPLWYHSLNELKYNTVTQQQKEWGWSKKERLKLFQWVYRRRDYFNEIN